MKITYGLLALALMLLIGCDATNIKDLPIGKQMCIREAREVCLDCLNGDSDSLRACLNAEEERVNSLKEERQLEYDRQFAEYSRCESEFQAKYNCIQPYCKRVSPCVMPSAPREPVSYEEKCYAGRSSCQRQYEAGVRHCGGKMKSFSDFGGVKYGRKCAL